MKKLVLLFLSIVVLCAAAPAQIKPVKDLKPTVILISLDGFRYDYFEKYQPKTLNKLAAEGVKAKWMTPSFPSKTFPNHYTIVTGLYPAHHGIVENNVYDFGTTFSMSKVREVQNSRWWFGEPIWVTAEKQGQISASYFFVGSEAEVEGIRPTFWRAYNGKVVPQMRVDKVLSWLDYPVEKRPTMITLYFSDVDDAAHEFSPEAEETGYAVRNVDSYIAQLMAGLKARKIDNKVNVIIVSDHGMAVSDQRKAVFLDDHFDFDKLTERIIWTNEIVQIFPKPGMEDAIMNSLKNIQHTSCWRKKDIPARFHYQDSPRIAPVICSSEEGWMTTSHKRYADWTDDIDLNQMRGAHGFDNELPSMRASFVAHGPAFKKRMLVEPFSNVQVYNVMTRILGLTPAKNDGNFDLANEILKKK